MLLMLRFFISLALVVVFSQSFVYAGKSGIGTENERGYGVSARPYQENLISKIGEKREQIRGFMKQFAEEYPDLQGCTPAQLVERFQRNSNVRAVLRAAKTDKMDIDQFVCTYQDLEKLIIKRKKVWIDEFMERLREDDPTLQGMTAYQLVQNWQCGNKDHQEPAYWRHQFGSKKTTLGSVKKLVDEYRELEKLMIEKQKTWINHFMNLFVETYPQYQNLTAAQLVKIWHEGDYNYGSEYWRNILVLQTINLGTVNNLIRRYGVLQEYQETYKKLFAEHL